MSKVDIIRKHISSDDFYDLNGTEMLSNILAAMDEYAQGQVKLFAIPVNELKKAKCYKCGADMYSKFSGNWHDSENCDKPKKAFNYSQEA